MRNTIKSLFAAALIAGVSGMAVNAAENQHLSQNSGTYNAPKMEQKAGEVKSDVKDAVKVDPKAEVKKDGVKVETKDIKVDGKTPAATSTTPAPTTTTPSTDSKPKM